MALSTYCHFCTESAPFYKRLNEVRNNTRMIAVLPQPTDKSKAYLEKLGVSVDEIRQSDLENIGIRGTPTLILVDQNGGIRQTLVGKLSSYDEEKLMGLLR